MGSSKRRQYDRFSAFALEDFELVDRAPMSDIPQSMSCVVHVAVTFCLLVLGCSSDGRGGEGVDGGTEAGTRSGAALPEPPRPPIFLPCPTGWTELQVEDLTRCEPAALEGSQSCADGEVRFARDDDCRPIGSACPSEAFAAAPDDAKRVHYVSADVGAGGDGSAAKPFATIGEAFAKVADGDAVLLSKGVHSGGAQLPSGITMLGACAAQTVIQTDPARAALTFIGTHATVGDVSIVGGSNGIRVDSGTLTLQGVSVRETAGHGLLIAGDQSRLLGSRIEVRDTKRGASEDGRGVVIGIGAQAQIEALRVEQTASLGLWVAEASAIVEGAILRENSTELLEARAAVRASYAGVLELSGAWVEGAVQAVNEGTSLTIHDAQLGRTLQVASEGTPGLFVADQASLELQRVHISKGPSPAILAEEGSSLSVEDVHIDETMVSENAPDVVLSAADAASVSLARVRIDGGPDVGMLHTGVIEAQWSDIDIRGTYVDEASGVIGFAVLLLQQNSIGIERLAVRDATSGIAVLQSHATLMDVSVQNTGQVSDEVDLYGVGLIVAQSDVVASRLQVDAARVNGVAVEEASLQTTDLTIANTQERLCGEQRCEKAQYGSGLVALTGSTVTVDAFDIDANALCGVRVLSDSSVDMKNGRISSQPIGINIEQDDYDVRRLSDGVVLEANDRNIARVQLPAPQFPVDFMF